MNALLAVVLAYLLGSIPFAYLAGLIRGIDLRTVGSGNLGAANVFRALGKGMGVVAVLIARLITDDPWPAVAAGAAMAGHVWPVWLRFKGGKGVAVGGGAVIGLMPLAAVLLLGLWAVVLVTTRYSSLASIVAAAAATPVVWAMGYPTSRVVFVAIGCTGVLVLHRSNMRRLLAGTENRITFSRRSHADAEPGSPT